MKIITKRIISIFLLLLTTLIFHSCQQEEFYEPFPINVNNMDALRVSSSFNWKTEVSIGFYFSITTAAYQGMMHKISVYNGNPFIDGQLLVSGSLSNIQPFKGSLQIPSWLKKLYVLNEAPNGIKELIALDVLPNGISHMFDVSSTKMKSNPKSPDCTSGCNQTITTNGVITVSSNKTYCVPGNFTGSATYSSSGGKLRICGVAQFTSISMGSKSTLEVSSGAKLNVQNLQMKGDATVIFYENSEITVSTLKMDQSGTSIINYSSLLMINTGTIFQGSVDNYGVMKINGSVNVNGIFANFNETDISSTLDVNEEFGNYGSLNVDGNIALNSQSLFTNECKITCGEDFSQNNSTLIFNNGYLYCGQTFQVNGNTSTTLANNSMISANDIVLNATIFGQGSRNTLKSSGYARINGAGKYVNGSIEWADNNGVLNNGSLSNFINGATFKSFTNATNIIPTSECNPEGIGVPQIVDSDGDGVADNIDLYPSDATKAYNNWYPSQNVWGTLAYEDLWPTKGDFDFNDMVIAYKVNIITNAQNKVVELQPRFYIKAIGATIQSGFGIQFDNLTPSDIASINGCQISGGTINIAANGTETGTSKAVVIVFDSPEASINRVSSSPFFNTLPGEPKGTSDTVSLLIVFANPLAPATLGQAPYNPFIFRSNERGHEVHLPNYQPTSKVDLSLFNTYQDASNISQGRYYKTINNLPWALNIVDQFDYPAERNDIIKCYFNFDDWAQTDGTNASDWYKNLPGYRNSSKIY